MIKNTIRQETFNHRDDKNSIKQDRQPLTSLERSLKIQSWVNQW